MKDLQIWALMNAGGSTSVQQVEMNDEGQIKTSSYLTVSDITVDTDLDKINGVTIAQGDILSAGHLRVHQVSDAGVSVQVMSSSASVQATIIDSTGVGYSGSNPLPIVGPVVVTSITNTSAASIVDSTGVAFEGANPLPITGSVTVASTTITGTVAANIVDSTGVAFSGANPLDVDGTVVVSSITATTAATLVDSTGVAFAGANPLPVDITDTSIAVTATDLDIRDLTATDVVTANLSATDNAVLDQIELNTDPLLVVGTGLEATAQRVTIASDSTGVLSVDDNASSLTIDNAQLSVVGSGTEAAAMRVTIATDSTGVLSVDDNAASLTVDNTDITAAATSLAVIDDWDNAASDGASISGDVADDVADAGEPVKVGGIARTANRTAATATRRVAATFDDLGRQLMRPIQVRDLIVTAYATLTTGTETTLLAGTASAFNDLIWVMAANNSDAAVSVDFRASTGGTVTLTLQVPANGTAGISAPIPYPQPINQQTWTADMTDITGTTVSISALFSQEV